MKRKIALFEVIILLLTFVSCGLNVESTPVCAHEWEKATCNSAAKCKLCGAIDGQPLGHRWQEENCYSEKLCTRCGITSGEKLEHVIKDGKCELCGFDIRGNWGSSGSNGDVIIRIKDGYSYEYDLYVGIYTHNTTKLLVSESFSGDIRDNDFEFSVLTDSVDFYNIFGTLWLDFTIINKDEVSILGRTYTRIN